MTHFFWEDFEYLPLTNREGIQKPDELDYIKASIDKNFMKPMRESNRAHIRVRDSLKEYGIDESEYYGDDDL